MSTERILPFLVMERSNSVTNARASSAALSPHVLRQNSEFAAPRHRCNLLLPCICASVLLNILFVGQKFYSLTELIHLEHRILHTNQFVSQFRHISPGRETNRSTGSNVLSENDTRQAVTFWTRNGVVHRTSDESTNETYILVEDAAEPVDRSFLEEPPEEDSATANDGDLEQMRMCESFILGMLKTFMSLTLDQIHQKLKFFMAGEQSYDKDPEELHRFLMKLVQEEKISLENGNFKPV